MPCTEQKGIRMALTSLLHQHISHSLLCDCTISTMLPIIPLCVIAFMTMLTCWAALLFIDYLEEYLAITYYRVIVICPLIPNILVNTLSLYHYVFCIYTFQCLDRKQCQRTNAKQMKKIWFLLHISKLFIFRMYCMRDHHLIIIISDRRYSVAENIISQKACEP